MKNNFKTGISNLTDDWSTKMFENHGWLMHYVFGTEDTTTNIHTHGILENFNHLDLQCVLPVSQETVQGVFNSITHHIKEGVRFEEGIFYKDIIANGFTVEFIKIQNENRELLRVILPDEKGRFPGDESCNNQYKIQYIDSNKKIH